MKFATLNIIHTNQLYTIHCLSSGNNLYKNHIPPWPAICNKIPLPIPTFLFLTQLPIKYLSIRVKYHVPASSISRNSIPRLTSDQRRFPVFCPQCISSLPFFLCNLTLYNLHFLYIFLGAMLLGLGAVKHFGGQDQSFLRKWKPFSEFCQTWG